MQPNQQGPIEWHADFQLGVPQIDQEHEELFKILKRIQDRLKDPEKQKFACVEGIKFMRSHTLRHFAHEEEYMRSIGYEGYEIHKQIHQAFVKNTLPAVERHLEQQDYSPKSIERFVGICIGWLVAHTLLEDRAIVGKVDRSWDDDHNPDVNEFLSKSLVRVMRELANIELRPVTLHYSGERIGQTLNYQIIYDDGKSERPWEVTVAMELSLIIKLVNVLFGSDADRLDDIALEAFKELIQMIIHRMGVFQKQTNEFKVLKDGLLTELQLELFFETESPKYSLLFGTDHGLMVFATDEYKGVLR